MRQRLVPALGFLACSIPLVGHAGQIEGIGGRIFVADKGIELPVSRDALFELAPAARDEGEKPARPATRDDLFALEPPAEKTPQPAPEPGVPATRDALFGDERPAEKQEKQAGDAQGMPVYGYFQSEFAWTYSDPRHWSKVLGRLELGTEGRFGQGGKWKLSGRVDYNPVYDLTDFYHSGVGDKQRLGLQLRETYVDFATGDWEWRVGRQHVVWGEMVGLFFADVVSVKDSREFILPDFQILRIPQWAVRSEYFSGDFHAELVWIPFAGYDEIGEPFDPGRPGAGTDFYPYPLSPAGMPIIRKEVKPANGLDHTNFGARLSRLVGGWDLSGFYYTSMDSAPTFLRDATAQNVFTPVHKRIWQAGGTLAKDLGTFVLKAEAVYTDGRQFNVTNLTDSDGVVAQNTLDWAVGLDFNPSSDTRLNTQFFQRVYFDHEADINFDRFENAFSILVHRDLPRSWEADVLLISSLNRSDWLLRPKATWKFERDWRAVFGLDIFKGPPTGIFGQYDANDRVYAELRRDF